MMIERLIKGGCAIGTLIVALGLSIPGIARAQAPKPEKEVVLAGYGGTIEQFTRKMIAEFEKQTGIHVNLVVGTALSNYSKVLATKERPEIDIYWSNGLTHAGGKQLGRYEKLDPKLVTNLPDVFALAKDPDGFGVASYVTDEGLQYNVDEFKKAGLAPPTSWFDLWDPKFKGKVALYSFKIAFSQDLLALMARLTGGDENNVDKALAKIKELKTSGNAVVFANTPAEMDNIMVQGQAWLTYNVALRALID
jgi:putative spermidine/putrescine transport system substrate-binding protein